MPKGVSGLQELSVPAPADSEREIDPAITVIVPTLGRPVLRDVLRALGDGSVLPAAVVLIDQGEKALPAAWCSCLASRGVRIDHVRLEPNGPSTARNRAIECVATPYFASIDDDCIPAPDWLAAIARRLREAPDVLVTGRVSAPEGAIAPSTNEGEIEVVHRAPYDGDPLLTGNFAVAVSVARKVGAFDERLSTAEDNDWGYRALRLGVPIAYAPEARVTHQNPMTLEDMAEVDRRYAFGQGLFMGKHMARGDWFIASRFARASARLTWAWLHARGSTSARNRAALRLGHFLRGARRGMRELGAVESTQLAASADPT
jgi:hypothetical protein